MKPRPAETAAQRIEPWPRGRCEFWKNERVMCGKKGRWMVDLQIRCGEHKHA